MDELGRRLRESLQQFGQPSVRGDWDKISLVKRIPFITAADELEAHVLKRELAPLVPEGWILEEVRYIRFDTERVDLVGAYLAHVIDHEGEDWAAYGATGWAAVSAAILDAQEDR